MPGNTELGADCMLCSAVKWPKRDRATISGHRSAAQNGQNSAPTKSTSGLPAGGEGGWPAAPSAAPAWCRAQ